MAHEQAHGGDGDRGGLLATPVQHRGAMTFQAPRHRIGEGDLRALLRQWVGEHEAGNVTPGHVVP